MTAATGDALSQVFRGDVRTTFSTKSAASDSPTNFTLGYRNQTDTLSRLAGHPPGRLFHLQTHGFHEPFAGEPAGSCEPSTIALLAQRTS
jgi:hypothetical protein